MTEPTAGKNNADIKNPIGGPRGKPRVVRKGTAAKNDGAASYVAC